MLFKIIVPPNCNKCVFCQEGIYCGLLYGEPLYPDDLEDYDYETRAEFCPFDSKEKWNEIHEGVKIIEKDDCSTCEHPVTEEPSNNWQWAEALAGLIKAAIDENVVRCKDCEFGKEVCGSIRCHKPGMREYESELHPFEWFCADGQHKRRNDALNEG